MPDQQVILNTYRQMLRLAKRYPSKKRLGIISDIKAGQHSLDFYFYFFSIHWDNNQTHIPILFLFSEFRDHKTESDPQKLNTLMERANIGLQQLQMYTQLTGSKGSWEVSWADAQQHGSASGSGAKK
jgi:hypothetical protein